MTAVDEGGVKYLLSDWQGSNRAVVSNSGYVLARNDYTAYGEEIASSVGLRTVVQGFASNLIPRQKYGLTERDEATGLDHTWFRKHEPRAGRWTSPDPYGGSMSIADPQSFNRYSYVGSQPLDYVDPSGLFMIGPPPRERTQMEMCFLFGIGCYQTPSEPIEIMGGGGGGGGGTPNENTVACGNNPITGRPGINAVNSGTPGEIRPGERGRGHYGAPRRNAGRIYTHTGTDVAAPVGTPVLPLASGKVSGVTGSASDTGGYGLMITINHGNGYTSRYGHLSDAGVTKGDRAVVTNVTAGVIGWSGQSGNASGQPSTEAHVHFEIRKNGKVLNPEKFLNSPCPKDFKPNSA
ncbi:MAG: peptidoglycan DD-metalloendopeptidase family protein [Pyrinomonadaceae bacterium]|nr:peptidoglycan DD-metalloendopeptidase family protein [Pyrinomonadaceae bacterium]